MWLVATCEYGLTEISRVKLGKLRILSDNVASTILYEVTVKDVKIIVRLTVTIMLIQKCQFLNVFRSDCER